MKVLWQQLLGYLVVILIAVGIFAFRIEREISDDIYQSREEQLLNYGNNIVNNNFSRNDLVRTFQLLASEDILIQVYLNDGRTIYPYYDQRFDSNLSGEELDKLQNGQALGFRTVERMNPEGEVAKYLTVYLPHRDVGQFPPGFISLAAPLDSLSNQLNSVRYTIGITFAIASLIALTLSVFTALLQTQKIKRLQRATKQIGARNFEVDIDTSSQDEWGDLARDFQTMAQSLDEFRQEIKRQETLRRQFMMDAAHEMRTPLTTMNGLLEGLQHGMIPEKQRDRSLELIQRETQRLTRLVNENLDYEKIRSRQFTLKPRKINGVDLFEQIQIQMSDKAQQKGNHIRYEAAKDLVIYADYDRIIQVLINLVTNAIQFSQDSEIRLEGVMLEDYSEIRVIDHGIGIDPAEIERIWERFYKVDVSRKNTEFGESGIGLAVVQSLVEAHHGKIQVASEVGQGTTFIIHLPHAKHDKEEQA